MNNLNSKLKQVEALKNGNGLQFLLDEAYKIFGNPLLMHDLDFKAIAYTENHVTDDNLWNEFVTIGGHSRGTRNFFMEESLIDVVASAKTTTVLSSDKMKYDRLLGKVFNKNNIFVCVVDIVACYKPLEEDDMEAFEAFCRVLSKELGSIKFFQEYGDAYQENLIRMLVNGDVQDKKFFAAHVEIVYSGLKSNLYLAVADITQIDPEHTSLPYFRDLFRKTQPEFKYAIYSDYILILIGTDDPMFNINKDLSRLNKLFHKSNIYAGISSCFENLYELQKYYKEALSALKYGYEITSQRIFLYEQFKYTPGQT